MSDIQSSIHFESGELHKYARPGHLEHVKRKPCHQLHCINCEAEHVEFHDVQLMKTGSDSSEFRTVGRSVKVGMNGGNVMQLTHGDRIPGVLDMHCIMQNIRRNELELHRS
jgi:hypothetical protein